MQEKSGKNRAKSTIFGLFRGIDKAEESLVYYIVRKSIGAKNKKVRSPIFHRR